MLRQPHQHHDGPIDTDLLLNCYFQLVEMLDTLVRWEGDGSHGWYACRGRWIQQSITSQSQLNRVTRKVVAGQPIDADGRKIIDIILSVLADFEAAKAAGFRD